MAESAGEKSFDATPHRRQEAREKGQVVFSQDLGSAAMLMLGALLLMMLGGGVMQFFATFMRNQLGEVPDINTAQENLVSEWDPFIKKGDQAKFIDYLRLCTRESISLAMGVSRNCLHEYTKGNGGFYDTVKSILEDWETRRNAFHMCILPYFPERKTAVWIFLSKNFNRFVDEIKIGNVPGEVFRIEEVNRRIMRADPDKIAESIRRAQLRIVGSTH